MLTAVPSARTEREKAAAYPRRCGTGHNHRETESKATQNGKGHEQAIIRVTSAGHSYFSCRTAQGSNMAMRVCVADPKILPSLCWDHRWLLGSTIQSPTSLCNATARFPRLREAHVCSADGAIPEIFVYLFIYVCVRSIC